MLIKKIFIFAVSMLFVFSGCNESNSEPEFTTYLNGTVALGEAASAEITLVGANGKTVDGNADSDGNYKINTSFLSRPIIVKATLNINGVILYSFASTSETIANVTPLTSYIVDQAAVASGSSGGASQLYARFLNANPTTDTENDIQIVVDNLNGVLSTVMQEEGVSGFNHFNDEFTANHQGYDAVLDRLDMSIYGDDIIIRIEGNVLDTLNYDIAVDEINASGSVYDISTDNPVADANVTFVDGLGNTVSTQTDVNGSFTISIDTMRVYDVVIEADGFEIQNVPNIHSFVFTETSIGNIPVLPTGISGTTQVSGKVIDGRTADTGIRGVTLTFRDGFGERLAEPVSTVYTDANGNFSTNLPVGVYTVEIDHDLYYKVYKHAVVYGNTANYDFSILYDYSAIYASGFFATITLNWDEEPSDLDSHLTGPIPNTSDRYHMYYARRVIGSDGNEMFDSNSICANGALASLDRDRIGSLEGLFPETTTICNVEDDSLYKYYVHHFSGLGTIRSGNAEVIVSTKNGLSRRFTPPSSDQNGTNDIWHVFNIDSNGNIYPINEIIGSDVSVSNLFVSPSRNKDIRFSSEKEIFDNLPFK